MFCLLIPLAGCVGTYPAPTPTPTATPTATPTPASTATPEPTASPTPYHKIYPITFGLSNDVPYQNEFFNLSIDLDDLWFAEPTKRLDQYNGFLPDMTNKQRVEEYLKRLKNRDDVYDFFAHTDTGLQTIQIRIKNGSNGRRILILNILQLYPNIMILTRYLIHMCLSQNLLRDSKLMIKLFVVMAVLV